MFSTNRTDRYLLSLHHSFHQANIHQTRPAVDTYISPATERTLQHAHSLSHSHNRFQSIIQSHQIEHDNHKIIERLMALENGRQLRKGGYVRYNQFQRGFRKRNPKRDQKMRMVQLQNQRMYRKLAGMKARVGSKQQWSQHSKDKQQYRRFYSKFGVKSSYTSQQRKQANNKQQLKALQASIKYYMEQTDKTSNNTIYISDYPVSQTNSINKNKCTLPVLPNNRRHRT